MNNRQIDQYIWDPELIGRKMVFLSGPRQVGKTTYAKQVINARAGRYFNWDLPETRRACRNDTFFFIEPGRVPSIVVFDEIHKQKNWKNILKGIYDGLEHDVRLLVTGSARLEWFRKSGDSLIGRYSHFHLFPLSIAELCGVPFDRCWLCSPEQYADPAGSLFSMLDNAISDAANRDAVDTLLTYGGFPEPFFSSSQRFLTKWNRDYLSLLLTEDLRDLSNIRDIDRMEHLTALLPGRIGSPLSMNALATDLETGFATVKSSIAMLERLWLLFSLTPYSRKLNRAVKKERKTYFVNWTFADSDGAVFENFIALQLMRACAIWNDTGFANAELRYARNFDGREIDFIVTLDKEPVLAIEAKLTDDRIAEPQMNLARALGIPIIQVVRRPGVFRKVSDTALVVAADRLLGCLP